MGHLDLAKKVWFEGSRYKRKAVIVGIDKYRLPGSDLSGCVADAKDMANTLLVLGFPPTRIKVLTDEKATKQNIIKKLEWLVKDADPGDVLVYYHSGHGTQKADLENEEHDKLDEMVIPHDFSWNDPSTHLTDDDFYNYFTGKTPPDTRCEVIIDTCYSGAGTRSLLRTDLNIYKSGRYLTPPLDQLVRINTMIPSQTEVDYIGKSALESRDPVKQHNVLWSACLENQVAWELMIGSQVRGAFTYNLCQILRRSEGNRSRRDIYQILRTAMANAGYEQTPTIETPEGRPQALDQFPLRRRFEDTPEEVPGHTHE